MAEAATFRQQQRGVAVRMAAALAVTVVGIAAALYFAPNLAPSAAPPAAERVAMALQADLFVVVWLFASIANVARMRFLSPKDIDGSGGATASVAVRQANAVLHNTLEQVVLAVPVHLALAAVLARSQPLIIALVVLFGLGRTLFWTGYAKGAAARARICADLLSERVRTADCHRHDVSPAGERLTF